VKRAMSNREISNTRVAVIGPFHNDQAHVLPWLTQFANQSFRDFTLYVVDDDSSDRTVAALRELSAKMEMKVRIFVVSPNQGPAAARNVALRAALEDGADLLCLLDSDCRIDWDWLERHVQFHETNPGVGIVGGAIQSVATTAVGCADGFCSWFTAVPGSKSGFVRKMHLSSTNMSMKRSVFEALGGFDEQLATGEDVAYCRLAQRNAITLWFQSDIVIRHLDRNEVTSAKNHHYRWGLHSFTVSTRSHGGYYDFLRKLNNRLLVMCMVPVFAFLNVGLVLWKNTKLHPKVYLYLPWIIYLKWWNAVGVYHGFVYPDRCLRTSMILRTRDNAAPQQAA
jgi:GT2 family glycosyltransferase